MCPKFVHVLNMSFFHSAASKTPLQSFLGIAEQHIGTNNGVSALNCSLLIMIFIIRFKQHEIGNIYPLCLCGISDTAVLTSVSCLIHFSGLRIFIVCVRQIFSMTV